MFGFSKKKILMNAVKNACKNNASIYEVEIKEALAESESISEDAFENKCREARKVYFDACCESMVNSFEVSSPNIAIKVKMALAEPSIVGLDDYDVSGGVGAGALFFVCLNSLTGNKYSSGDILKEVISLNHFQNDVMNEVLHTVDDEYSTSN